MQLFTLEIISTCNMMRHALRHGFQLGIITYTANLSEQFMDVKTKQTNKLAFHSIVVVIQC
jgi:hypothetical protein